jgi:outer membrane protein assembly factor BamD
MEIGRYYLRQGKYVAAINRFQSVIDRYQTTTHVPEALHRLTEAYLALGVQQEARKTAAVLGYNFPGSRWYQDSYALLVDGAPQSDQMDYWINGGPPEPEIVDGAPPPPRQRSLFDWGDIF